MANKAIYDGSPGPISGSTPFGFYDNEAQFQIDGPKFANFAARKVGYPIMEVELEDLNFYAAFEEAVTTYGNELYLFKIRENYLSLEGSATGSALNNTVVNPGLNSLINIANNYGEAIGIGGSVRWYTGSLALEVGVQNYDMTAWASSSANLAPGDSISIRRVFFEAPPAQLRYFDPFAGSGFSNQSMLDSFGWGSYSTAVSYMMYPIFFDIQRIQEIEMSDYVRRSAFTFEITDNILKIFPIPGNQDLYRQSILRFEYSKQSEMNDSARGPYSGSANLVTNMGNVPYNNPTYTQINAPGKYWIYEYGIAIAKEILGYIRGKYTTIPIPGDITTLNQGDLLTDARAEKTALIEKLRDDLEKTTRHSQLERKQSEGVFIRDTLQEIPMMIFIG